MKTTTHHWITKKVTYRLHLCIASELLYERESSAPLLLSAEQWGLLHNSCIAIPNKIPFLATFVRKTLNSSCRRLTQTCIAVPYQRIMPLGHHIANKFFFSDTRICFVVQQSVLFSLQAIHQVGFPRKRGQPHTLLKYQVFSC